MNIMQNKKLIILVVLGVLAIFSLIYGILTPSKTKYPARERDSDIQTKNKIILREEPILTKRITKRTNYTSWARNPFTFQKILPKASEGLILSGIIWDKEEPMAIINGEILKIGDNINANLIIDIKQDRVILNDGTNNFELRLD
jgi:hypothetical protein